ncbi:Fe2OG dioxygenase domain-containing protein [Meloidogyne graminicola]|uniref:procollagen-proline 4-dioxygenase n=1 Tax=Meloidogyne graminicola TaxID=189291 RepID=A0A8S9ZIE8_9BILA|nr:Fe2OG dioxygenase domain-containing protein [Meloidogyne graminicola]
MYYLLLILFLLIKLINNQELFTSSAELQQLINIENKIPKIIENYIILENERLENLKRETRFPTEDDLNGAIQGLLRLQDTYKLKTKDLANGILLNNINIKKQMNDCYEIGMNAFNEKDYYHSLLWIQEAYERNLYEESPEIDGPNESEILNILSISLYKQGNLKRALEINNKLIKIDPYYPNAINNSKLYEQELKNNGIFEEDFYKNIPLLNNPRWLNEKKGETNKNLNNETNLNVEFINNITLLNNTLTEEDNEVNVSSYLKYEELCRGEVNLDILEISKLYCYYKMDNSFLRLAPIKRLYFVMFKQATVQDPKTGESKAVPYRISKSAWLSNKLHPTTTQLDKRIELMTNLNMKSAELLQVGNYGIGGHYDVHYDFSFEDQIISNTSINSIQFGNRISTVLFYFTTPEKGGYTAFIDLEIIVKPTKNDAVFWYNLLRSGKGDLRTKHAACPVLIGEKWVSNSWIHERGQEFIRPCALSPLINERYVELFTSSAELQQLINIENKIPKIIENYIILENERLENLKRETRFPTEDDLNGAIQGLLRLQDTYKLKTKDLANGILLNNINIKKQMNALEINNKLIKIDPYYPNAINNSKLYEQELKNNGIFEEDFYKNIPLLNNPRCKTYGVND